MTAARHRPASATRTTDSDSRRYSPAGDGGAVALGDVAVAGADEVHGGGGEHRVEHVPIVAHLRDKTQYLITQYPI